MAISQTWFGNVLPAGPSDSEKQAWTNARLAEIVAGTYVRKRITADFEPLPGWKPFKDYGTTPAEIIANAMKNNDRSALFIGDWVEEIKPSGSVGLQYRIAAFDQYLTNASGPNPYHHALMIPETCWQVPVPFSKNSKSDYDTSYLLEWGESEFYKTLPSDVKDCILEVSIPWWDESSNYSMTSCHVFSLGEVELFGAPNESNEKVIDPGGADPPNHPITMFRDNASRIRRLRGSASNWWTRSGSAFTGGITCIVTSTGELNGSSTGVMQGVVPCFCLGRKD